VTFVINGSILLGLILIPLVFPDALPRHSIAALMVAPNAPASEPTPPPRQHTTPFHGRPEMADGYFYAPRRIPKIIATLDRPEDAPTGNLNGMDSGPTLPGADGIYLGGRPAPVVHADVKGPVRVSSMVVAGLLIRKTIPPYPAIARAMGIQGTVVLQATISKSGTIENLRVVSGPAVLQQAALDAVKTWQYRPYLLNKEPVEVETTVSVVFTIAR
jgi:protein TonB